MNEDKDLEEKCLSKRTITQEPTVTKIENKEQMKTLAEQHKNNSEYFYEAANNLLKSSTPLVAILIAHFAMEHKANQLLALHGYKIGSHVCSQIGLSKIAGRKDLAKKLSDIFTLRQSIGYRLTLKQSDKSKEEAEKTFDEIVQPFFEEADKVIKEINH